MTVGYLRLHLVLQMPFAFKFVYTKAPPISQDIVLCWQSSVDGSLTVDPHLGNTDREVLPQLPLSLLVAMLKNASSTAEAPRRFLHTLQLLHASQPKLPLGEML